MGDAGLDSSFSPLVRFFIATVLFVPAVLRTAWPSSSSGGGGSTDVARRDILAGGFQVGLLNGAGYLLQSFALKQEGSSATTIAFVASLSVVVVPILDSLLNYSGLNKVQPGKFGPAFLALAGVAFLELSGGGDSGAGSLADLSGSSWTYALASLGSASTMAAFAQPVFFGMAFYRLERVIQRCTMPEHFMAFTGSHQFAVFVLSCLWFVVSSMGGADAGESGEVLSLWGRTAAQASMLGSGPVIFSLLWTGLVTTAGCALFEGFAMKQLTGAEVTVIYSSEPLFATMWNAIFLGETVGVNTLVGAALIISACLLSQQNKA